MLSKLAAIARREPNGRRQRPTVDRLKQVEREARLRETMTVREQPHRKGSDHPWCADALGRFCLSRKLRRELHDAANHYANLRRWWGCAVGRPRGLDRSTAHGSGEGPSDETVRGWLAAYLAIDAALNRVSPVMWSRFFKLVIDDVDPPEDGSWDDDLIRALRQVAVHAGFLSGLDSAFH